MGSSNEAHRPRLRSWLDILTTRSDELRVQVHEAGMNPDEDWSPIEAQLRKLVELEAERDELCLQLKLARMEAHHELSALAAQFAQIARQSSRVGRDVSYDVHDAVTGISDRLRDLAKGHRPS
jgi:hypothetical protein